jgi:hypothetical protein
MERAVAFALVLDVGGRFETGGAYFKPENQFRKEPEE